jgi:hypothetical protein
MHTRYDRQTLSEDLVFRAARPAVGGRAEREDGGGPWKSSLRSDENNAFQARYIVRHYWGKKAQCSNPERNVWGGPPGDRRMSPVAARDLANTARSATPLSSVVKTKVPTLGLNGLNKAASPAPPPATVPRTPAAPAPPTKPS